MSVTYHTKTVAKVEVFYREVGPADAPVIELLHGFPTAGHVFRDLNPRLSDRYHVITPDLPGFGNRKAPLRKEFDHTVDNPARVIDGFIEAFGFSRYALLAMPFMCSTTARPAGLAHRERVTAIVSQSGDAYLDGLSAIS